MKLRQHVLATGWRLDLEQHHTLPTSQAFQCAKEDVERAPVAIRRHRPPWRVGDGAAQRYSSYQQLAPADDLLVARGNEALGRPACLGLRLGPHAALLVSAAWGGLQERVPFWVRRLTSHLNAQP